MLKIESILLTLPGLTPDIADRLVAEIDIYKANSISGLWKYAGFGVVNGEHERIQENEKPPYNSTLKAVCCELSRQLLKVNSPYAGIYYRCRDNYRFKHSDWTEAHMHQAALRKVAKIFLSHLWTVWRELEGLPTERAWILNHPNHTHELKPEDYGWVIPQTD